MTTYPDFAPLLLKKTLSTVVNRQKPFKLLDLGCGNGHLLYSLKKNGFLRQAQIYGLDNNPSALTEFRKKFPRAKTRLATLPNLHFLPSDSFDVIICNQVIEHITDDFTLLQEIYRLLKNNGVVYLGTIEKKWYGWYWYRNRFGKVVIDPTHVKEYTSAAEFEQLIIHSRLEITAINSIPGRFLIIDYFLKLIHKLGLIKFDAVRNCYIKHPWLFNISKIIQLPFPGYAVIEVSAQKNAKKSAFIS